MSVVRSALAALSIVPLAGCGSVVPTPASDAGRDGEPDAIIDDAGYTDCRAPSGYAVCGGAHQCQQDPKECRCNPDDLTRLEPIPCASDQLVANYAGDPVGCIYCPEGSVCTAWLQGTVLFCSPFDVGYLMWKNSASTARVRYQDRGLFTGAPLPELGTCPAVSGFKACGGTCGPCAKDEFCVGRSPLHPVGFCVGSNPKHFSCKTTKKCELAGDGCFVFAVEPDAQAIANDMGVCVPLAQCQALASGLPGGGTCTP